MRRPVAAPEHLARHAGPVLVAGHQNLTPDLADRWDWMRNLVPSADEDKDFALRQKLLGPPPIGQTYRPDDLRGSRVSARTWQVRLARLCFARHTQGEHPKRRDP